MTVFTYKPFYRFIYRYGNLPVTIIILIYMLPAIVTYRYEIGQSAYLMLLSVMLIYVNKLYLRLYKILPLQIEIDDEKIVCSHFFKNDKKIILHFSDIIELKGGVFIGKSKGLMQVGGEKTTIGFFHHLTHVNIFITALLHNAPLEVYKQVDEKIKSRLER
ncbi:MAG: hypothetical protein COW85_04200 [Ignavibacteria bacterium CG22_combo_CG10-13_8_21_14_all_37_15]|nr:hypothetical protein [Ignavibacteria bacterium]PIP78428.1 MAG: hypothetical protein COW85_04200 [Ignavibacteria bacterium CG22_combo_CG10-13_8_21_14_all_37_15]